MYKGGVGEDTNVIDETGTNVFCTKSNDNNKWECKIKECRKCDNSPPAEPSAEPSAKKATQSTEPPGAQPGATVAKTKSAKSIDSISGLLGDIQKGSTEGFKLKTVDKTQPQSAAATASADKEEDQEQPSLLDQIRSGVKLKKTATASADKEEDKEEPSLLEQIRSEFKLKKTASEDKEQPNEENCENQGKLYFNNECIDNNSFNIERIEISKKRAAMGYDDDDWGTGGGGRISRKRKKKNKKSKKNKKKITKK